MTDQQKIKISIADRIYPLTISTKQEEGLRKAAQKIERMIKQHEQNYAVRDKQDVLAMCALQFAAQLEQQKINKDHDLIQLTKKIKKLDALVDSQLC